MSSRIIAGLLWTLACACAAERGYTITTVAGAGFTGDGGPALEAQLGSPEGLAYDRAGNLYVADGMDHRVRRISPEGVITTVAGNGRPGAQLNFPYGLACDAEGNLYIADLGNARILKRTPDGAIQPVSTTASFLQPRNVAVDASGALYVSDFGAHRVYRIAPDGAVVRVAGTGAAGAIDDRAAVEATLAPLNSPAGLAFGRDGALYIADSGNHRIRKVLHGQMTTVPAPGELNTPTGLAVDGKGRLYAASKGSGAVFRLTPSITTLKAQFTAPRDLAIDSAGRVVIADAWSWLKYSVGVLHMVDTDGFGFILAGGSAFHSSGDGGPAQFGFLWEPNGLALDSAGALFVADRGDHRVRRIANGLITTVAGIGFAGAGGDDGLATSAQVDRPESVAVGTLGELWIAESGRLRRVDPGGAMWTVPAPDLHATAIALTPEGDALVADNLHHVVRRVSPAGASFVVAGADQPGYAGDAGPAAAALLDTPTGLCLNADGALYIADSANGALRKVGTDGTVTTIAHGLWSPARVAIDSHGVLYVADSAHHRVWKVAPGAAPFVIAGTGAPGLAPDGARALTAALNDPADIAVDAGGAIYIAERGNGLVRRLDPDPAPPIEIHSVLNAASLAPGPIAPGEILTLYGAGFEPGATRVAFDGVPSVPLYADAGQVNVRAPATLKDKGSITLEVRAGDSEGRTTLPAAPSSPGLFTLDGVQALALNEDGSLNSTDHPAAPGAAVTLYGTGEGVLQPIAATVANLAAAVLRIESAEGVLRLQVRVPAACPPGPQPVVFTAGGAPSQPGVTLMVR